MTNERQPDRGVRKVVLLGALICSLIKATFWDFVAHFSLALCFFPIREHFIYVITNMGQEVLKDDNLLLQNLTWLK